MKTEACSMRPLADYPTLAAIVADKLDIITRYTRLCDEAKRLRVRIVYNDVVFSREYGDVVGVVPETPPS